MDAGKDTRYWAMVALAAAVCLGLTAPFFLPYIQMQDATGFARRSTVVFGQHQRVADLVGVGASVVGNGDRGRDRGVVSRDYRHGVGNLGGAFLSRLRSGHHGPQFFI